MVEDMFRLQQHMDELFDDFFERSSFPSQALLPEANRGSRLLLPSDSLMHPLSDFWESDKAFHAEVDLPGIDKKDIKINVSDGVLEIKGEKKTLDQKESKGVYRFERSFAGYFRRFALPKSVDPTNIDARLENGVLKLTIPKRSLPDPSVKQIEVK